MAGDLELYVKHDATHACSVKSVYNGVTKSTIVYTDATNRWLNVQILAKSNTQMDVFVWDRGNFTLAPKVYHKFADFIPFTNTHFVFHKTSVPQGVLFSELRAFVLSSEISWGVYYRYYKIIDSIPANMIKYTRVSDKKFYLEAHLPNATSIDVPDSVALGVAL